MACLFNYSIQVFSEVEFIITLTPSFFTVTVFNIYISYFQIHGALFIYDKMTFITISFHFVFPCPLHFYILLAILTGNIVCCKLM